MTLNFLYALTLLPKGNSERIVREIERDRNEATNTYHRLSVDGDEVYFYKYFHLLFITFVYLFIRKFIHLVPLMIMSTFSVDLSSAG